MSATNHPPRDTNLCLNCSWGCMCLAAIIASNIFNLIYGNVDSFFSTPFNAFRMSHLSCSNQPPSINHINQPP